MRWNTFIFRKNDPDSYFHNQLDHTLSLMESKIITTSNWDDFLNQIRRLPVSNQVSILDPSTQGFSDREFRKTIIDNKKFQNLKVILIRQHLEDEYLPMEDYLDVDGTIPIHSNMFEIRFLLNRLLFSHVKNSRLHARAIAQLVTEFKLPTEGKREQSFSIDASMAGAFLQTVKTHPVSTQLDLILHLPGHPQPIECKGTVVHERKTITDDKSSIYPFGMGVRFEEMMTFDRTRLQDYLYPRLLRCERRATNRSVGLEH